MPTANSKPNRKKADRVHPKHAAVLIVLDGGKVENVYFHNASGHVFVADLDELKGLSPEEAAAKVLNGVGSITLDHKLFEQELESIFAGPAKQAEDASDVAAAEAAKAESGSVSLDDIKVEIAAATTAQATTEPEPADSQLAAFVAAQATNPQTVAAQAALVDMAPALLADLESTETPTAATTPPGA